MFTDISKAFHVLELLSHKDGSHRENLICFLCIKAVFQLSHGLNRKLSDQEIGSILEHRYAGIAQFSSISNESILKRYVADARAAFRFALPIDGSILCFSLYTRRGVFVDVEMPFDIGESRSLLGWQYVRK